MAGKKKKSGRKISNKDKDLTIHIGVDSETFAYYSHKAYEENMPRSSYAYLVLKQHMRTPLKIQGGLRLGNVS